MDLNANSSIPKQKVTLKQWVDDNEKILTVTGVFGALAAYFSQLPGYGKNIALTCLVLFIILTAQVFFTFPFSRATETLNLFAEVFCFFLIMSGFYFIQRYWHVMLSSQYSGLLAGYSYMFILGLVYKKMNVYTRVNVYATKHNLKWWIVFLAAFSFFVGSSVAVLFLTPKLIHFLAPSLA